MDVEESLAYLDARIGLGVQPGTERMEALMEELGRPQETLRAIGVSGTNGKFSVAAVASAILEGLGLTVGTYTSPHVESLYERFRIAGRQVSPEAFADAIGYLAPYIAAVEERRGDRLTYFETLTAAAIELFFDRGVGVAVLETGLGGEWDATNVVDSQVAVVTSVQMDHVAEFGGDLERAAWEKAGIVKPDATVVVGVEDADLLRVVEQRAAERGANEVLRLGREIGVVDRHHAAGGQTFTVQTGRTTYEDLFLPVFGLHQADNAAMAVAACEAFVDGRLDHSSVAESMAGVRLPARIEVVARRPLVVVDGGHNPHSTVAVLTTLTTEIAHERLIAVVGMLEDKQVEEVMGLLAGAVQSFHLSAPVSDRSASPRRLASALQDAGVAAGTFSAWDGIPQALSAALAEADEQDLVLVYGSFYTAGEALSALRESGRVPQR